ncbi:DNA-binding protein [Microbacterium sp. NPDC089695]|uniref:DNA-binding protein n=1 Tax=Microbacterium sp. NPDC089695 TaxID=3364198 RepID=UPI0037FC5C00
MSDDSELPAAMGKVARRELSLRGFTHLDHFDGISERELLAIHGVGPKAIRILKEDLASAGRSLAP